MFLGYVLLASPTTWQPVSSVAIYVFVWTDSVLISTSS